MRFFRYVVHKLVPIQNACDRKKGITQPKIDGISLLRRLLFGAFNVNVVDKRRMTKIVETFYYTVEQMYISKYGFVN